MTAYHPGAVQFGGLEASWSACLRCQKMRHECKCTHPLGSTDLRTTMVEGRSMTRAEALEHERKTGARE